MIKWSFDFESKTKVKRPILLSCHHLNSPVYTFLDDGPLSSTFSAFVFISIKDKECSNMLPAADSSTKVSSHPEILFLLGSEEINSFFFLNYYWESDFHVSPCYLKVRSIQLWVRLGLFLKLQSKSDCVETLNWLQASQISSLSDTT